MDGAAVQLWTVGDDGLSQRFAEQLELALYAGGRFVRYAGEGPPPLRIGVSGNVRPISRGRVTVPYELAVRGRTTGRFTATCTEARLDICIDRIVRNAEKTLRR